MTATGITKRTGGIDRWHSFAKTIRILLITAGPLFLFGCDSVSVDEVTSCASRFASFNVVEGLSPQEIGARSDCHKKILKFLEQMSSQQPGAYKEFMQLLERRSLDELDSWIPRGGRMEEVNSLVGPACATLVTLYASPSERKAFPTKLREEWDYRVGFCVKGTVHRQHPQPEFENKELLDTLCAPGPNKIWSVMCRRAGVR